MEGTKGQEYILQTFHAGLMREIDEDMIPPNSGIVLNSKHLRLDEKEHGSLQAVKGDVEYDSISLTDDFYWIGGVWVAGYLVTFWHENVSAGTDRTVVYMLGSGSLEKVAESEYLPGRDGEDMKHLDIDANYETGEIFITDGQITPIILDVNDLWAQKATTKYTTAYDATLYNIKLINQVNQPKFISLDDVGAGAGLRKGSYAYSLRYGMFNGEYTPWGPLSPYIPVPENYDRANTNVLIPGSKVYGGASDLVPSRYGIRLLLRINNAPGFDFIELKRYANQNSAALGYTPSAEFLRVGIDAGGSTVNISEMAADIIEFQDTDNKQWIVYDETEIGFKASIKSARTIRYYEGRVILGGIKYESRELEDLDIFINAPSVSKLGYPIKKNLGTAGYTDINNQVFNKTHRLGERYGYAAQLRDDQGNVLFSVPLKNATQDFRNFKFPERREGVPASERIEFENPSVPYLQDVDSGSGTSMDFVYEVWKSENHKKTISGSARQTRTIFDDDGDYAYNPITPTGRDPGYGGNGRNYKGMDSVYCDRVEGEDPSGYAYDPTGYGASFWSTGFRLGGIDISALPDWVAGFSVVRTPAAGRVVCQGIATYALLEKAPGATNPALQKDLDKVWFYSPEFDTVIGDKVKIYDDIKTNPASYSVQLVSPLGFFSELQSGFYTGVTPDYGKLDFLTWATMQHNNAGAINPTDANSEIGTGNGYISFGRFRNWQGNIYIATDHKWGIASAVDVDIDGKNGRSNYLEITLDVGTPAPDHFYYNPDLDAVSGDTYDDGMEFHEPLYIVNIIQDAVSIPIDNTNLYQEIGHYQKLRSIIGYGSGDDNPVFYLADERPEDCIASESYLTGGATSVRYIEVNGQKWLDLSQQDSTERAARNLDIHNDGYTTIYSINYYGTYLGTRVDGTGRHYIIFDQESTGTQIIPAGGDEITVVYNSNVPIDIYLGDNIISLTSFVPIDCEIKDAWLAHDGDKEQSFRIRGPMPYRQWHLNDLYRQAEVATESGGKYVELTNLLNLNYLRQWLIMFPVESTVNIPLVYKNFFPHRAYVMRPNDYSVMKATEDEREYYARIGIARGYADDYPGEQLMWGFGGFHFPEGSNFDYSKLVPQKAPGKPASSESEVTNYPKRFVWTVQKSPNRSSSNALKSILPTNFYDLSHYKSEQISILYDQYSSRGNNLYVVTDKAVGLLLTDKTIVRDFVGDSLGIAAQEGNFIQGEQWLNESVGCPANLFRGKSEGIIKVDNRPIDILTFPTINDIAVLRDNTIVTLKAGMRDVIESAIGLKGNQYYGSSDDDKLFSSFVYSKRNELWINAEGSLIVYSFIKNNWIMELDFAKYTQVFHCPWLTGALTDGNVVIAHDRVGDIMYAGGFENYETTEGAWNIESNPTKEVTFVCNPGHGRTYEFIDIYVKAYAAPTAQLTPSRDIAYGGNWGNAADIAPGDWDTYGNNWFYARIPRRTTVGTVVKGNLLYVKLSGTNLYNLKYVKIGYRPIQGG